MDFLLSATEPARKKEQHLTFADRVVIQTRLRDAKYRAERNEAWKGAPRRRAQGWLPRRRRARDL